MMSYVCTKCDGKYASSQSLWNHKQRCKNIDAQRDQSERAKRESKGSNTLGDLADAIINDPSAKDLPHKRMENDDTSRQESDDNVQRTKAGIIGYNQEKTLSDIRDGDYIEESNNGSDEDEDDSSSADD